MANKSVAPSAALALELARVGTLAADLKRYISHGPNTPLPKNFPIDQIVEICIELTKLPHGSHDGCATSLLYARKRLAAARREHIPTIASDQVTTDIPVPVRGEQLDHLMGTLEGAIGPALDQYQIDEGADLQERPEVEEAIPGGAIPGVGGVRLRAQSLSKDAGGAASEIAKFNEYRQSELDSLQRQITDTEIQNGLAGAELGMPRVRPSWLQSIAQHLRRMPGLIEATGRTVQRSVHVSEPVFERWNDFQRNWWNHLLNEIRETGKMLEEVGRRLREPNKLGPRGRELEPTPHKQTHCYVISRSHGDCWPLGTRTAVLMMTGYLHPPSACAIAGSSRNRRAMSPTQALNSCPIALCNSCASTTSMSWESGTSHLAS